LYYLPKVFLRIGRKTNMHGFLHDIPPATAQTTPLGRARVGFCGRIHAIIPDGDSLGLSPEELERRLIELGFVEGASVEILHEGAIGRDPIAVRVDSATVALRRREAMAILVV
jgi:ferrous iron transport protein A